MKENVQGHGGRGFLMFALGTTAGAVVALLTAPGSGKETRRRLRGALHQARGKAGDVSASLAKSYGRGTEALRNRLGRLSIEDPAHAGGARDGSRPAMGMAPKSETKPATT